MNPLSRYVRVEHLTLSPGYCWTCRSNDGPFIDTQVNMDWDGRVYICVGCIKEMHSQLGLDVVLNREEVDQAALQAFQEGFASGKATALEAIQDAVTNAVSSAVPVADLSDIVSAGVEPVIKDSDTLFVGIPADAPALLSGFEQVDSLIGESGRESVPGDSSNGNSGRASFADFGI